MSLNTEQETKKLAIFSDAPIPRAVLWNALPATAAQVMVLIYNLADTFFIGQTHDALQVAAVSLVMPVFLVFMSLGTMFGIGGTSVISRALGRGDHGCAQKVCSFCMWGCVVVGMAVAALSDCTASCERSRSRTCSPSPAASSCLSGY